MRENCTYGSMRGRAFPTGRPALLYTLAPPEAIQSRQISWELHFVFRDSRNRHLVKDVFRLPM